MPAFTLLNKHGLRGRQRAPVCQDCSSSVENVTIMGGLDRSVGNQPASSGVHQDTAKEGDG